MPCSLLLCVAAVLKLHQQARVCPPSDNGSAWHVSDGAVSGLMGTGEPIRSMRRRACGMPVAPAANGKRGIPTLAGSFISTVKRSHVTDAV